MDPSGSDLRRREVFPVACAFFRGSRALRRVLVTAGVHWLRQGSCLTSSGGDYERAVAAKTRFRPGAACLADHDDACLRPGRTLRLRLTNGLTSDAATSIAVQCPTHAARSSPWRGETAGGLSTKRDARASLPVTTRSNFPNKSAPPECQVPAARGTIRVLCPGLG